MKPESSKSSAESSGPADPLTTVDLKADADPLRDDDALWNMLGNTAETQPDPFFARNTVRAARQLDDKPLSWRDRVASFLTPRVALTSVAAACVGLLIVTQLDHGGSMETSGNAGVALSPNSGQPDQPTSSTDALEALVIEESLLAAAEDPSQFTHDELLTIVGL